MIDGLDGLRLLSPEEAKTFPEPTGKVELTLAGAPLPYDAEANAYLIPQSAETEGFDGAVELRREAGYTYYLCPSAAGGKAEALSGNVEYGIYAVRGDSCRFSRVLFTPQTVLCLTADSGELPGEEREEGDLAVYSVRDGHIVREQAHVEVNERGNTSRRFPKKSYRLHIQNAQGDKHHLDIAGLRSDDDWILNPLYADTSKIRERLGYELWDAFNSSGSRAAASRLVHVEVFLNGAYWGCTACRSAWISSSSTATSAPTCSTRWSPTTAPRRRNCFPARPRAATAPLNCKTATPPARKVSGCPPRPILPTSTGRIWRARR